MDETEVIEATSEVGDITKYPSVTERYYKPYYYIGDRSRGTQDLCILTHSNRICLVTLAASHEIFDGSKKISIDFQISKNVNRMNNKAVGKSKKGAQWLNEDSVLCKVICEDGTEYNINSGIRGNLIEVNEHLQSNPQLILTQPQADGYIAIVLPRLKEYEKVVSSLLTKEQYEKILQERTDSQTKTDS